jgi:hypothetical protein
MTWCDFARAGNPVASSVPTVSEKTIVRRVVMVRPFQVPVYRRRERRRQARVARLDPAEIRILNLAVNAEPIPVAR